jgi:hypothetical protein
MKKILTLLIAGGAFISAQAQTDKDEARRVILGGGTGNNNGKNYPSGNGRDVILGGGGNNNGSYPNYPNNYPSNGSGQSQVDQVNREYDAKINSIRNNPYLSYEEKERAIRQLEKDRQARVRQINNSNSGYYGDDDYNKRDRGNNGKHKGWYKKEKNKNWKKGNRG